jgi:hypothetical protein
MKRQFIFYSLIWILLLSCQGNHKESKGINDSVKNSFDSKITKKDTNDSNLSIPKENQTEDIDSLIFDSVRINKMLPLKSKESDLIKNLGQPDSIVVEHGWDCGNYLNCSDSVTLFYYGQSRFLISDGEALLHILFLSDSKLSFGTSNFQLTGKISESQVKYLFPKSYNYMMKLIENNTFYGEKRIKVKMSENSISYDDNGFIFYFEKGWLVSIELWWFIC